MELYFPDLTIKDEEPRSSYEKPLPGQEISAVGAITDGDMPYLSFKGSVVEGEVQTEPSNVEALVC